MARSLSGDGVRDATGPVDDDFLLPSRKEALTDASKALDDGLVLISGEAGVGKTWLARRLAAGIHSPWMFVDAFPGMTPNDLIAALTAALTGEAQSSRAGLREALAERSADGFKVFLAIDEGHLLSSDVLEEVRLLTNRWKQTDGFAGLILIGQTRMAMRVESGALRALESRVAGRVHLRPLNLDEAASWLQRQMDTAQPLCRERFERLHRDGEGNPRKMWRISRSQVVRGRVDYLPTPTPERTVPAPEPILLGNAKPPLRMEEGLIEVGYDPVLDMDETQTVGPRPPSPGEGGDESPILDHYAALQAWDEWAKNQVRGPIEPPQAEALAASQGPIVEEAEDGDDPLSSSNSWVDEGQAFAPYSQLFSRLKPSPQAD